MEHTSFITYNRDFSLFGSQHLAVIMLMISLAIILPWFAKRFLNGSQQLMLSRGMAVTISFWVLLSTVILWWLGDFNYKTDLPLDICNITAFLLPFLMWNPTRKIHEVLYFWILAGTVQAIITPYLYNGFPNFIFFKYWFVHAGLVVFAVYTTVVFDLKPIYKSIWRAFLALQGYVVFILIVNLLIGSNYVYVLDKPPTTSLLDYLGPWPWYLLICELLCLMLFFLVFVPVWVHSKRLKVAQES